MTSTGKAWTEFQSNTFPLLLLLLIGSDTLIVCNYLSNDNPCATIFTLDYYTPWPMTEEVSYGHLSDPLL